MTYKDQFVVEVKADGQILRVRDGAVYLPFGCEYSILLKNLNSRNASVKVSIDNEDVLDGNILIIPPLMTHELKGFFRGTTVRNAFRFIQKTKQIQDHRGDRVDDGLVRVEFAFEKPKPEPTIKKVIHEIHEHHYHKTHWPKYTLYDGPGWTYYSTGDSNASEPNNAVFSCNSNEILRSRSVGASNVSVNSLGVEASFNAPNVDEGITVKGNELNEQYNYSMIGELEQSSVIVIQLKGMQRSSGVVVQEPITVSTKLECSSCGTKSKSSFKFCPNCGTFLV
jgi:hypothetical protein